MVIVLYGRITAVFSFKFFCISFLIIGRAKRKRYGGGGGVDGNGLRPLPVGNLSKLNFHLTVHRGTIILLINTCATAFGIGTRGRIKRNGFLSEFLTMLIIGVRFSRKPGWAK